MFKNESDFIKKANVVLADSGYYLKDNGNNVGIFKGEYGDASTVCLSPIAIFPTKITKRIGRTIEVFEEISTYYEGELQPEILISGKLNNIEDKMLRRWGPQVVPHLDSDSIDVMVKVFYLLTKLVCQNEQYLFQGWTNKCDGYVLGNLLIKPQLLEKVQSNLKTKNLMVEEANNHLGSKFVTDYIFKLTDDGELGMHLLVFAVLSFARQKLVELCASCPSFVFAIIGPTNSRKTSIVNAVYNPFGLPNASFEDTEKAIVQALKVPSYASLIIDDFNIGSAEKRRKFEVVVRNCGDLTTNSHKVVGGRICHDSVANMCIITGESIPKLQVSSMPRMLIYELSRESVDLQELSKIQKNPAMVVALFVVIIQALFDDDLIKEVYDNMLEKRQSLQASFANERILGRYLDIIAWMQSGWEVLISIFPELSSIDYPMVLKKRVLLQHKQFADDPVEAFKFCLEEMQNQNMLTVVDEENLGYQPSNPDLIITGNYLFIVSRVFFFKMLRFYEEEFGRKFPCKTEAELRNVLRNAKKLHTTRSKLNTSQCYYNGKRISGFYVYKNLL